MEKHIVKRDNERSNKAAEVMHPNIRSARLLEKCGFHFDRLRKAKLVRRHWIDNLIYSMLRSEFKVRKD